MTPRSGTMPLRSCTLSSRTPRTNSPAPASKRITFTTGSSVAIPQPAGSPSTATGLTLPETVVAVSSLTPHRVCTLEGWCRGAGQLTIGAGS